MKFRVNISDPCDPMEYLFMATTKGLNEVDIDVVHKMLEIYDRNDITELVNVHGKQVYRFGRLIFTEI